MGLDHYLDRRTYVQNWSHQADSEKYQVVVFKGAKPVTDIKPERITTIVESVAVWRKFNALHRWFVENVQDGVDNCGEYYVGKEKLTELLDILKKVKASLDASKKTGDVSGINADGTLNMVSNEDVEFEDTAVAEELLPTTSGFFFGGTGYDRYYYEEVVSTIEILENVVTEDGSDDFYYSSSW